MPFTHVELEEHKTRKLLILFGSLIVLYAASILALFYGLSLLIGAPASLGGTIWNALGIALVLAVLHWSFSTHRLADRVLFAIGARPLQDGDAYHTQLRNIVEEVGVATGGRFKIEPYIIASTAMNACAIRDFSGRAAIAVTEGLLARLNRAQLESVVGHEAAHIASGDSLFTSVFVGLFGLHEEALKRLTGLFSGRSAWHAVRGRGALILVFVMFVLWVTNKMKRLCEVMVSRAQEYRADAVAVRLTRNPLALAEALHLIAKRWRGMGAQGESFAPIFIMDPEGGYLTERDGLAADLFTTHPPTERRIELLLGMGHVRPEDFERAMAERAKRKKARQPSPSRPAQQPAPSQKWMVRVDEAWKGPFLLTEMMGLEGLTPDSWICREGEERALPAHQDSEVLRILRKRYGQDPAGGQPDAKECPNCRVSLSRLSYEGVPLDECPACRGCYVTRDQLQRVFARQDYAFPDSIKRLAKSLPRVTHDNLVAIQRKVPISKERLKDRQCPACSSAVIRKFYTNAYPVEVEQCWMCGLTWLDRGELELLQYLHEQRTTSGERPPVL